ncbi:hypothetical protein LINGRAHAP2_LOCUS10236 [Linum grandiflorum]
MSLGHIFLCITAVARLLLMWQLDDLTFLFSFFSTILVLLESNLRPSNSILACLSISSITIKT